MDVVLDSNVLFRILISPGDIIDLLFDSSLTVYAPEKLRQEFLRNKTEVLEKSRLSSSDMQTLSTALFEQIIFIPLKEYKTFLPAAKHLLGTHEKDEDFVALALLKHCKIWTYETRLFSLDIGITTKQLSTALRQK